LVPRKRRPKGWTPERRARQAALIRLWQPERRSSGPRSEAGKARSAMNALKHGGRSRAHIMEMRRMRYVLRLTARNIAILRTYNRITRLERALAHKPRALDALPKLQRLRDALARLTNAAPPKPPGIRFLTPSAVSS
jgi:hypothetical protein